MSDESLDADLQDLLDQLDDNDEFMPTPAEIAGQVEQAEQTVESEEKPIISSEETNISSEEIKEGNGKVIAPTTGDEVTIRPVDQLLPTDARRLDIPSPHLLELEDNADAVNFQKYLIELDGVTSEVLQACRADRQEAQDVINMLRKEVDNAINKGKPPSRMFIDGLVKSVEVKAGINATAVKMMDSVAKVLASTKSGINIQNNNLSVDGKELDELLSQDVPDDLE